MLNGVVTSISTAIVLLLSSVFFDAPLSKLSIVACAIVFLSSWTYIRAGSAASDGNKAGVRRTLAVRADAARPCLGRIDARALWRSCSLSLASPSYALDMGGRRLLCGQSPAGRTLPATASLLHQTRGSSLSSQTISRTPWS